MYCRKCGNLLKEDERFCSNCGERREEFSGANAHLVNNVPKKVTIKL